MIFIFAASIVFNAPTSTTHAQHIDSFCKEALLSKEAFSHFRRSEFCLQMIDNCTQVQGIQFLTFISEHYPHLLKQFDLFRANDLIGDPLKEPFGRFGAFCPTTLRYVKIAGDLQTLFGDLSGKRVIEIGGGYGGQCRILSTLFSFKEYVIVDLPQVLELTKKYLDHWGLKHVRYMRAEELPLEASYDLVISNYAFSECNYQTQVNYLEKILLHSQCGYMICNDFGYFKKRTLYDYLIDSKLAATLSEERPLTGTHNYLITWR